MCAESRCRTRREVVNAPKSGDWKFKKRESMHENVEKLGRYTLRSGGFSKRLKCKIQDI